MQKALLDRFDENFCGKNAQRFLAEFVTDAY